METLQKLLNKALKNDIQIQLYNYDANLKRFVTVTFNHLNDITNDLATLHYEKDTSPYFYFWYNTKNKAINKIVKDILYCIASIMNDEHIYTDKKTYILKAFEDFNIKSEQIFNVKYNYTTDKITQGDCQAFTTELNTLLQKYKVYNNINKIQYFDNIQGSTITTNYKNASQTKTQTHLNTKETFLQIAEIIKNDNDGGTK